VHATAPDLDPAYGLMTVPIPERRTKWVICSVIRGRWTEKGDYWWSPHLTLGKITKASIRTEYGGSKLQRCE
jgi:hypothetical protein